MKLKVILINSMMVIARNPATGEPVEVPEKEVVKFKPSKNILNMKWL